MNTNNIIKDWIENVIVGLNLCPFAKIPFQKNQIRISIESDTNLDKCFTFLLDEIDIIYKSKPSIISNSIVVFDKLEISFRDFYDFVLDCEEVLLDLNLSKKFQLVCFHPDFQFEKVNKSDKINLVNSSPYPLIHILRSDEVENAISSLDAGININLGNEKKLNSMNDKELSKLFGNRFQKK